MTVLGLGAAGQGVFVDALDGLASVAAPHPEAGPVDADAVTRLRLEGRGEPHRGFVYGELYKKDVNISMSDGY